MPSKVEALALKLARVNVKPHIRRVGGKTVKVKGFDYERRGGAPVPAKKGAAGNLKVAKPEAHEAHTGRRDLSTLFGQQAVTKKGETAEEKHHRIARERERYAASLPKKPLHRLEQLVDDYREHLQLAKPNVNFDELECSMEKGKKVARAFLELESNPDDPKVKAAYADLVRQTKDQFDLLTRPEAEGGMGVTVEFVDDAEPYPSAEAQALDMLENKRLRIATISIWPDSHHPILGNERGGTYDMFRAVHDAYGHVAIGGGFDRHGEYCAWVHHSSMFTGPGRIAASTELHGENSVLWTTGVPPEHKAALLPEELVANPIDPKTGNLVRLSKEDLPPDDKLFAYLDSDEDYGEGKVHYDGIREVVLRRKKKAKPA